MLKVGPAHKSEGGGVRLGLAGHDEVVAAYESMAEAFGGEITGAVLQPFVTGGGVEGIVGGIQDPSFGPLVVFELGGTAVEVLGDETGLSHVLAGEPWSSVWGVVCFVTS